MKLIKINCEQCGGTVEMDYDKMMAYCPYCGSKLMIDVEDMKELLLSKEETKRVEIISEHDRQVQEIKSDSDKNFMKMALIMMTVFFGIFLLMVLIGTLSM